MQFSSQISLLLMIVLVLSGQVARAEVHHHALLIGINEYASPKVNNLNGAVNDVTMMRRILVTRLGFDEANIRVLTNEEATRKDILKAIDTLVAEAGEEDVVYFHYSGHGSRQKDRNGDEDDGFDETILSYDARTPGVKDILDDELEQRFARIRSKHVLLVFDSCHSGTITRSSSVLARTVPPDERAEMYEQQTREVIAVKELPHVLMAGAPPDQEALDAPIDEGFYGLFTYSLARTFDKLGPAASPREVHSGVKSELERIQEQFFIRAPEPQLEGPQEEIDSPVLLTDQESEQAGTQQGPSRRAWLTVVPIDGSRVRLLDGVTMNAQPGSQWAIYLPGESRFDFGNAIAFGVVKGLSDNDSILELELARQALPEGSRAVMLTPPDISGTVPLRIEGVSRQRQSLLQELISERHREVEFVGAGDFARFVAAYDSRGWSVTDAAGLTQILAFPDAPDEVVAQRLSEIIVRSSHALALLALQNPASDIGLDVRIPTGEESVGSESGTRGLTKVSDNSVRSLSIRKAGEPRGAGNSLLLEVRADRDVYLTVVDVDTEGNVNLLFPNSYQNESFLPDGYVPSGTVARIPDSLEPGNAAGFHWDYSPPAGRDTILVFASETLEMAGTIRQLTGQSGGADDISKLRSALGAAVVRGVTVVPDRPSSEPQVAEEQESALGDWTSRSIVIDVRE